MAETTDISWTHHTWSPWWGCVKVSRGCEHCYAEGTAKWRGHDVWGPAKTTGRRMLSDSHWRNPTIWDRKAAQDGERRRVFPSMCDPFEMHPMLTEPRRRMFDLIRATPNLDWLLLTKRPENIEMMLPTGYWPNVWLGTSTEDQATADHRVPFLIEMRGRVPVLFLSVEPQLGPVDLWDIDGHPLGCDGLMGCHPSIGWVIQGGESGAGHRRFDLDWARSMRDDCRDAGVAYHFKQFGGRTHAEGGCLLDGREWKEFPAPRQPVAA